MAARFCICNEGEDAKHFDGHQTKTNWSQKMKKYFSKVLLKVTSELDGEKQKYKNTKITKT